MHETAVKPIFIVGAPRSGTTLLSAMLSNHTNLSCGPESQLFNKSNLDRLKYIVEKEHDWVQAAYEEMIKVTLGTYKVIDLYELSKKEFEDYLNTHSRSIRTIFDALYVSHMEKSNKFRWIEKTPDHLKYLEHIRFHYPEAYIIRIMRDPRDSVASMKQIPWTSHSFVENSVTWMSWYKKSAPFFNTDHRSINIRYEDLVERPRDILEQLCKFIGEEYEESMLDTSISGGKVSTDQEPWKAQVSKPLDTKRMYVWKNNLDKKYIMFSAYYFRQVLRNFSYEEGTTNNSWDDAKAFIMLVFRKFAMAYKKRFA